MLDYMAGYSWKGMNNNIIKEIVLSGFGFACVTGDVFGNDMR